MLASSLTHGVPKRYCSVSRLTDTNVRLPKALNIRFHKGCRGFTLVEVLVTLTVAAILFMLAIPSFTSLIQSSAMSSTVNSFLADMRYARSEAMRRGGGVVMCRSDAPEAANPTCGSDAGLGGAGWATGWIIYLNLDPSAAGGNRAAGDPILRVQAQIPSVNSITETGAKAYTSFRFTSTGRLLNLSAPVTLEFGADPAWASAAQRTVCIGLGGYAKLAGNGVAPC